MQLAQIANVAYSTIKNVYRNARVQTYSPAGLGVLIDAEDLAVYFAKAKRGRPHKHDQYLSKAGSDEHRNQFCDQERLGLHFDPISYKTVNP